MLPLAVATTTADKLREVPTDFWLKLGLAVVALIAVIVVLRKVADMNRFVLTALALFLCSVVGFNWIYERNEPVWATPFVSVLSGFFPTKAKVVGPTKPPAPLAAKKR